MTEPIDRTKAPDPLPETLPIGVRFRWQHGPWRELLAETGKYDELYRRWPMSRWLREDGTIMDGECVLALQQVDWESYWTALAKPKVGEVWETDAPGIPTVTVVYDYRAGDYRCDVGGTLGAFRGPGVTSNVTYQLTRRTKDAPGTTASSSVGADAHGPEEPEAKAVVPVRPDPYVEHRTKLAASPLLATEESIARMTELDPANKKLRQASAQLDRACARRYPYADNSVVWSTPSAESDP